MGKSEGGVWGYPVIFKNLETGCNRGIRTEIRRGVGGVCVIGGMDGVSTGETR